MDKSMDKIWTDLRSINTNMRHYRTIVAQQYEEWHHGQEESESYLLFVCYIEPWLFHYVLLSSLALFRVVTYKLEEYRLTIAPTNLIYLLDYRWSHFTKTHLDLY